MPKKTPLRTIDLTSTGLALEGAGVPKAAALLGILIVAAADLALLGSPGLLNGWAARLYRSGSSVQWFAAVLTVLSAVMAMSSAKLAGTRREARRWRMTAAYFLTVSFSQLLPAPPSLVLILAGTGLWLILWLDPCLADFKGPRLAFDLGAVAFFSGWVLRTLLTPYIAAGGFGTAPAYLSALAAFLMVLGTGTLFCGLTAAEKSLHRQMRRLTPGPRVEGVPVLRGGIARWAFRLTERDADTVPEEEISAKGV